MRRTCFTLLTLIFVVAAAGSLKAQKPNDLYCAVTYEGQNRNRTVAGAVNVECGFDTEPHGAPFGNWGVDSFYGDKTNTDQFRGWKPKGGKLQWNSCTTRDSKYVAPHCTYYNANGCTTQRSNAVVTHGIVTYRSANQCPQTLTEVQEPGYQPPSGCLNWTGATVKNNNMEVIELDSLDPTRTIGNDDDPVENLYFPSTSVTFTDCNYHGCSEKTSAWVRMTGSSSASADVRAELRMKAKAQVVGVCNMGAASGWNWE